MTVPALFAVVCMTSVRTQATGSNPPDRLNLCDWSPKR